MFRQVATEQWRVHDFPDVQRGMRKPIILEIFSRKLHTIEEKMAHIPSVPTLDPLVQNLPWWFGKVRAVFYFRTENFTI